MLKFLKSLFSKPQEPELDKSDPPVLEPVPFPVERPAETVSVSDVVAPTTEVVVGKDPEGTTAPAKKTAAKKTPAKKSTGTRKKRTLVKKEEPVQEPTVTEEVKVQLSPGPKRQKTKRTPTPPPVL